MKGFKNEGKQPGSDEMEKGELVLERNGSAWWSKQRAKK